ncbi:hypothetical protein FTUN_5143 [Frigoriglobus tundricola]|uniref:Uncharacterized protein n=1 Tax=Frigoriglobus tundricola TaxID=2774151 RepID=A0A6M5YU44_9BACT|nr:hypothetical protein FTUN_5143 [Frigoriglobus tundricola]
MRRTRDLPTSLRMERGPRSAERGMKSGNRRGPSVFHSAFRAPRSIRREGAGGSVLPPFAPRGTLTVTEP